MLWTLYARTEAASGSHARARAMFNRAVEINQKDWYVRDNVYFLQFPTKCPPKLARSLERLSLYACRTNSLFLFLRSFRNVGGRGTLGARWSKSLVISNKQKSYCGSRSELDSKLREIFQFWQTPLRTDFLTIEPHKTASPTRI